MIARGDIYNTSALAYADVMQMSQVMAENVCPLACDNGQDAAAHDCIVLLLQ